MAYDETTPENEVLAQAVRDGRAEWTAADRENVGPDNLILVTTHQGVQTLDLQQFADGPRRIEHAAKVHTIDALVRYHARHSDPQSVIWANLPGAQFVLVVDEHNGAQPGWRKHTATLDLDIHPTFKHWTANSGKWHTQVEFVDVLDAGRNQIADPDPATILEIAAHLSGTKTVEWQSGARKVDGTVQLGYVETATAAKAKGDAELPASLTLVLRPYRAAPDTITVRADLRWKLDAGRLHLRFDIVDLDDRLEELFDTLAQTIEAATGESVIFGRP
jgi:uncharacterized protein YfdQ (DUF2303 family)